MNPIYTLVPCVRCGRPTAFELHRIQSGRCSACLRDSLAQPAPKAKKGFFRSYSAQEVLDGWRLYNLGDRGRVLPKGLDRPGRVHLPNRPLLMYAHVEQFLAGRGDWFRRILKEKSDAQFEAWYAENPFNLVPDSDDVDVREVEELKPRPLVEACQIRGINPNRVREALRRARLAIEARIPPPATPNVWQPSGSPQLTTLAELDKWLATVKHGGLRL